MACSSLGKFTTGEWRKKARRDARRKERKKGNIRQNGPQAMRDDDSRGPAQRLGDGALDVVIGLRVDLSSSKTR